MEGRVEGALLFTIHMALISSPSISHIVYQRNALSIKETDSPGSCVILVIISNSFSELYPEFCWHKVLAVLQ